LAIAAFSPSTPPANRISAPALLDLQHLGREVDLALLVDLLRHDVELLGLHHFLEAFAHLLAVFVVLRHDRPLLARELVGQGRRQRLGPHLMVAADGIDVLRHRLVQFFVDADGGDGGHTQFAHQRQRGLALRRARQRGQSEHLVRRDQLAHALQRARHHVTVVLGDQPQLAPVDAAGGIGFGNGDLHAQVVGRAQQRWRAGQRQDVAEQDLGVGHTLLLGLGDARGQQGQRCGGEGGADRGSTHDQVSLCKPSRAVVGWKSRG
jgi:hypothetical protein